MDKQTINVPGAEALAQPHTRRDFFKKVAVAGVGATAGSALLSRKAFGQSGDIEIANFALTLEYLEMDFYAKALDSGVVSADSQPYIEGTFEHESAHVDALVGLIEQFGGTPVAMPAFDFGNSFADEATFLDTAATLEITGVGAYLGAAPMIQNQDVLAAAGSIAGVEGEHVVAINYLLGVVPPANMAFPEALSQDAVLEAIAPFMGGGMPDTGGPSAGGTARAL